VGKLAAETCGHRARGRGEQRVEVLGQGEVRAVGGQRGLAHRLGRERAGSEELVEVVGREHEVGRVLEPIDEIKRLATPRGGTMAPQD
jgi:hypothetical protein